MRAKEGMSGVGRSPKEEIVVYMKIYLAEFKRGGELNFKRFLSI